MIRRETDAGYINSIVNSPAVRPFVDYGAGDAIDVSATVARDDVFWLSDGHGGLSAFGLSAPREYQAHVFFGEECRGADAIQSAKAMVDWMRPLADRLWGAIPQANRAARWFGRKVGFQHERFEDGFTDGPVEIVGLRVVH